ncbi:MAG: UDP-3-O-acyl-N-acetylglucosamine deacetylase, partial [Alphaproteobacteria bacterium]|nr:UDP-3-O-acyl-N-acetylglucosamine deacetylase [Alphaproteobacteria bacterium]
MMTRRSLAKPVGAEGIALHAGTRVAMTLTPAEPGRGIVFRRTDIDCTIPALYGSVVETRLGTVLGGGAQARVGVIEHLMAAIAGSEIDDLEVVLDGPEPPILDGDALSYLSLIEKAGTIEQPMKREIVRVRQPVKAVSGNASAALIPANARTFEFEIEFESA